MRAFHSMRAVPGARSLLLVLALLATACATSPEQDPVVQRLTELDGRLLRIERVLSNQSLLQQAQRVDSLYSEVRTLRGQVEELQHAQATARTQQRELYADLDKRLQALESRAAAPASAATATTSSGAPANAAAEDDTAAYKKAFDLLKDGKYDAAIAAFTQFIGAYPQSTLLDNAQYWLGEAHYVGKDYKEALKSFNAVVDKYPDSRKVPDALLKIGYCQYELKNWKNARAALERVRQVGAGTASAKLAEQRLAKMQAEGH